MSDALAQTNSEEQAEKPKGRARRVISERSASKRVRLLEQLTNPVVEAEDVEGLTDQDNGIDSVFKPRNAWQGWLTSQVAIIMVRIDRCSRIERRLRDYASYRAIDFWEEDQKLEVETLAVKIDRQPARVVAKLRQTPAGCEWLLTRWHILANVAASDWTDVHRTLAGRLVGADPVVDPAAPGFAAEQVAELQAQRIRIAQADEILRGLVEADLSDSGVPGLAGLRRYARSLHRQLLFYLDQFHGEHPDRWDDPRQKPASAAPKFADRERERKSTRSFAGAKPQGDETKPTPVAATKPEVDRETGFDETKPIRSDSRRENDETKPIARSEAAFAGTAPGAEALILEGLRCIEHANERHEVRDRSRRVDPAREANRRKKMARQRAARASLSGA